MPKKPTPPTPDPIDPIGEHNQDARSLSERLYAAQKALGTLPALESRPSEAYRKLDLSIDTLQWRNVSIPVSISDAAYLASKLGAARFTSGKFANEGGEFGGDEWLRFPGGQGINCDALVQTFWNPAVDELRLNVSRWNANTPNSRWKDPFAWNPSMVVTLDISEEYDLPALPPAD